MDKWSYEKEYNQGADKEDLWVKNEKKCCLRQFEQEERMTVLEHGFIQD